MLEKHQQQQKQQEQVEQKAADEAKLQQLAETSTAVHELYQEFLELVSSRCDGAAVYLSNPLPAQSEPVELPERLQYVASVAD